MEGGIPTDSYCKSSILPISPFGKRHLAPHVRARPIEDFMGMAMLGCIEVVVVMGMGYETVVGVAGDCCHFDESLCGREGCLSIDWKIRWGLR